MNRCKPLLFVLLSLTSIVFSQDHLLISELVVTPTAAEYIELYNPTGATVDLSNYYLTDATFVSNGSYYYNIVTGSNAGGGGSGDFHARFPAGASIAAGAYQTIAMNGADFQNSFGAAPTYELFDTDAGIADMQEALSGSINGQGGLTNSGEVVILYVWDGQSDLVQDVDYVVWGDKDEAVDKSGIALDGPDPDTTPTSYLNDTAIPAQIPAAIGTPHAIGESLQRLGSGEPGETTSGGNGITGHDATSEDLATSLSPGAPTPNSGPPASDPPQISGVSISPSFPQASDIVTVSATVTDDVALSSVFLFFATDGVTFDSSAMSNSSGDIYEAQIAPQPENTTVSYFVRAEDSDGLTSVSATGSYTIVPPPTTVTIDSIQNDPAFIGRVVQIEGVITIGAGRLITTRTDAYIQDESGRGLNVFSFDLPTDPPNELLVRGNRVRMTGEIAEFNGVTEITNYSIELISTGNPPPAPLVVSTSAANSIALEGTLLETRGVVTGIDVFPDAANITINDGSGEALLRIWGTTGVDVSFINTGDSVLATCVMDLFNNAAQLVAAYQDQIGVPGVQPGDGSGTASVLPDSVGTDSNVDLTFTLVGESGFTIESATIVIPNEWDWVPLASNVQLSGSGLSGATVEAAGNEVTVRGAAITDIAGGDITISQLSTPPYGIFSDFIVRTATAGGTRLEIAASPTVKVGEGAPVGVTPIAQIQDNFSAFRDLTVTIEGVVTLGAGIINTSRVDAYIQDNSGKGINVFDFDPPNPADRIDRFNRLRLTGRITEFGGVTEIADYTVEFIADNQPLPDPLFVSSVIANDLDFEGTYIKVVGVVDDISRDQDDDDANIILRDDQGTVLLRIWQDTGINLDFLGVGDTLSAQGVMDVFSNQSQIVPAYRDELTVPGKTARADGSGIVAVSAPVVAVSDTLDAFTVFIAGNVDEPITTVQIDVPKLWRWDGSTASLAVSGGGLNSETSATISLEPIDSVYQIFIDAASIEREDTLRVTLANLITPNAPLTSVVWMRSAGEGGRLTLIPDPPFVSVAGGNRLLIYDLQQNSSVFSGARTVQGVTTIGAGKLRETSSAGDSLTTAYIQDESGRGINLFRFGLIDRNLVRGNLVEVRGSVTEFGGVTEIEYTSISVLAEGAPLPRPLKLSNAQSNSTRWDGTLVATEGIILERFSAGGGTSLEISDGRGATSLRIWDTARLDLEGFDENIRILVEGVSGIFISGEDTTFQLLPTYQDQLQIDENYSPSLDDVNLRVEPHPFVPSRGESIDIIYNAGAVNNQITIRIFDLGGRLVATILDESAQLIENVLSWNGRNQLREQVPLGTYLCHLEVIEPVTGKTRKKVAPIVVGTVLSR